MAMNNVTGIFLRKEVEELRKQGESWGLTKDEIDQAILRALGENSTPASEVASKTKNKKCSFMSRCLKVAGFIILLPILLYTAVSMLSMINPAFGLYIGQKTADLQYPLQRAVRLISLPLHHYFDLSKWSDWECMVDNPLYVPEKPDCALCEGVKKIASRSSANLTKAAFKTRFHDTALPVVVRNMPGYGDVEHSFEKFMEFYQANKADLEQDACEFKINGGVNDSITSLAEVLESWDHYKPDGKILGWKVCYGQGLRSLRALFPRPYCIHSEGALDKSVYLLQPAMQRADGSTEELVSELVPGTFDNVWVAQVTGSTVVKLQPIEHCEDKCETYRFTLKQGDVFDATLHETDCCNWFSPRLTLHQPIVCHLKSVPDCISHIKCNALWDGYN